MKKLNLKRYNKGFTLIELLVVIAIIGVLATLVVLAVLSPSKAKSNDSKITSQLSQMGSQAFLFNGTGSDYIVSTPYQVSSGITGAADGGTDATGILFNDTNMLNNSLYFLASKLPANTYIYYGWNGEPNATTGRWFFAASTSTGGFCVDWRNDKSIYEGVSLSGVLTDWTNAFPNAVAGTYLCN